jgi:uncharacterized metal-binding protein
MRDMERDSSDDGTIALLTCSSPSNAGRIAVKAAIALLQYYPGRIEWAQAKQPQEDIEAVARSADRIIVIDGCPTCCVMKKLNEIGLEAHGHIVVTDLLGVTKSMADIKSEEVRKVIEAIDRF